eukprot:symbB.v1.2.003381.t1/scaffold190.1/size276550/6
MCMQPTVSRAATTPENRHVVEITKAIRRHEQRKDWASCLGLLSDAHCNLLQLDLVAYRTAMCPPLWREALGILQDVEETKLQTDVIAFNRSITSCEKAAAWHEFPPDLISNNACLSALGPRWRKALSQQTQEVDLITYDALMSTCQKGDQWLESLHLLFQLKWMALQPKAITFNVAISACRQHWSRSTDIFRKSSTPGLQRSMVTYNAAMSALEEHWQRSLWHLIESAQDAMQPTLITYSSIISACEGQWLMATLLLNKLLGRRLYPNLVVMNACMSACEKCSQWQWALSLFDDLQRSSLEVDGITYTAILGALQQGGGWLSALTMINAQSLPCLEAAAGQDFPWNVASQILDLLTKASGRPSILSTTLTISAMAASFAWSEAMHLMSLPFTGRNVIVNNAAMLANARTSRWRGVLQFLGAERDATTYEEASSSCERGDQSLLCCSLLSDLQDWTLRSTFAGHGRQEKWRSRAFSFLAASSFAVCLGHTC